MSPTTTTTATTPAELCQEQGAAEAMKPRVSLQAASGTFLRGAEQGNSHWGAALLVCPGQDDLVQSMYGPSHNCAAARARLAPGNWLTIAAGEREPVAR
jgi:hypothetical protein